MDREPKEKNRIRALEKGLELLILLSRHDGEVGLEHLSREAGFSKPTCFRLLQTMRRLNFVTQSAITKGYRLGPRNISIGTAALDRQSVRSIAIPYMRRLREQTDETINLTILDGTEIVFVERIEAKFIINSNLYVGSRLPVYCSSMGKAILAYLPEHKLTAVLDAIDLQPRTANTITSRRQLLAELARIRATGTSINNEALEKGLFAVAGPIRDHSGEAIAALNVSFPRMRHDIIEDALAAFVPVVKAACNDISGLLGFKAEANHHQGKSS